MFGSYLYNHDILQDLAGSKPTLAAKLKECAGAKPDEVKKLDAVIKTIKSKSRTERAKRAVDLLNPVAKFCRAAAMYDRPFSDAVSLANELRTAMNTAGQRADFRDNVTKEPAGIVETRAESTPYLQARR